LFQEGSTIYHCIIFSFGSGTEITKTTLSKNQLLKIIIIRTIILLHVQNAAIFMSPAFIFHSIVPCVTLLYSGNEWQQEVRPFAAAISLTSAVKINGTSCRRQFIQYKSATQP